MSITKNHIDLVLENVVEEGHAELLLLPLSNIPLGVPNQWASLLSSSNVRADVIKIIWASFSHRFPRIIKALKRSLQGVGYLTTDNNPPSLIYFFTTEDDEPDYFRGYVPVTKFPESAKHLPGEFLDFFQVHDGWVDQFDSAGPLSCRDWYLLSDDVTQPAGKFLVVLDGGDGSLLGYDLRDTPAVSYLLPAGDEPPKIIPNIWKEIDSWISAQFEEFLPFSDK